MNFKVVLNKIYSTIKVLAVCLVLIAALGLIYEEFIGEDVIQPINKYETLSELNTYDSSIEPTIADSNTINNNSDDSILNQITDKIVYNASLSLTTYSFNDVLLKVQDIIEKNNIVLINDDYRIYSSERTDSFYLKVKSSELDNVINEFKELGNIVLFNKDAVNIDKQYNDIGSKIGSLETQLQRFYNLLNESDSISDISSIYDKIDYLETQLVYARNSLNNMDEDISYSTISLTITDMQKYNDDGSVIDTEGFFDKLLYSFGYSWIVFVNFILGAVILFVYLIPFLIVVISIALIFRLFNKKRNNKVIIKSDDIDENHDEVRGER